MTINNNLVNSIINSQDFRIKQLPFLISLPHTERQYRMNALFADINSECRYLIIRIINRLSDFTYNPCWDIAPITLRPRRFKRQLLRACSLVPNVTINFFELNQTGYQPNLKRVNATPAKWIQIIDKLIIAGSI